MRKRTPSANFSTARPRGLGQALWKSVKGRCLFSGGGVPLTAYVQKAEKWLEPKEAEAIRKEQIAKLYDRIEELEEDKRAYRELRKGLEEELEGTRRILKEYKARFGEIEKVTKPLGGFLLETLEKVLHRLMLEAEAEM